MKKRANSKVWIYSFSLLAFFIIFVPTVIMVNNSTTPSTTNTDLKSGLLIYFQSNDIKVTNTNTNIAAEDHSVQINSIIYAGSVSPGTTAGTAKLSSKIQLSDIVLSKYVDTQSSPQFWKDFFSGITLASATIHFYSVDQSKGSTPVLQLTITLTNARITSMVNSFSVSSSEQITLSFQQISMLYAGSNTPVTYSFT